MKTLETMKLRVSKNRLHQTDARNLKEILHEKMANEFDRLDLTPTLVENAIVIEIPHHELGSIPIEVKFVIKPLDYDMIAANEQFLEKQAKAKAPKVKG